jgi:hypothetical protein
MQTSGRFSKMTAAESVSPSAIRMRRWRRRQRKGLRIVPLAIRDREVTFLIRHGFLAPGDHDDRRAIAFAMGKVLDTLVPLANGAPSSWR